MTLAGLRTRDRLNYSEMEIISQISKGRSR
jgi:hypothetical protein